jgi:diguanylate cyclase (GGDEF)-like protein
MDDQTSTRAPRTRAATGHRGEPRPPPTRSSAALIDETLRAWADACETSAFGSCAITFDDPAAVVRAVIELTRAPIDPSAVESLEQTVLHFRIHPSVAVVQLVALDRELHRLLDRRSPDGEPEPNTAVDRAVSVAIAAVLDDLEQRGLIDPLTQLLNRRALDRDLVELIRTSGRNDRSLVVVMADLEGLKATNDTHGHSAGDERLRQAASTLAGTLRTGDNVYRIGGDEFVVVMPDLARRDLADVLGRVGEGTATTLTWGCAWARIMPDVDAEREAGRLLELADQRLLRYRWSEATAPIARDEHGEIVAGRFGPPSDRPRRRR